MDVALPSPYERLPRHRAKAEAACRAALADPEEIDLYRVLADPLLERHGIEKAETRTVVLRALDLGLDWTPRSA
jgi:hypothetical protein